MEKALNNVTIAVTNRSIQPADLNAIPVPDRGVREVGDVKMRVLQCAAAIAFALSSVQASAQLSDWSVESFDAAGNCIAILDLDGVEGLPEGSANKVHYLQNAEKINGSNGILLMFGYTFDHDGIEKVDGTVAIFHADAPMETFERDILKIDKEADAYGVLLDDELWTEMADADAVAFFVDGQTYGFPMVGGGQRIRERLENCIAG